MDYLLVVHVMAAVLLTPPAAVSAEIVGGVTSSVVNVAGELAVGGAVVVPVVIATLPLVLTACRFS